MLFLERFLNQSSSSTQQLFYEDRFVPLDPPVAGFVEIFADLAPRIKCQGTTWKFRFLDSSKLDDLWDGQEVVVVGRRGNCLFVELKPVRCL